MDIVRERLEREYELELVLTTPQVEYQVAARDGRVVLVDSPADLPDPSQIAEVPRAVDGRHHRDARGPPGRGD